MELANAPPAYSAPSQPAQQLSHLERLPSHLLLRVLALVPLQDLVLALRPASRALYLHAMSLARTQALPLWEEEVRTAARARGGAAPSTDPLGHGCGAGTSQAEGHDTLPHYDAAASSTSPLGNRTRELALLDLFLVSLSHSLAQLRASSLLFTSEDDALRLLPREQRAALWGWMQPRARCEDLLAGKLRARGAQVRGEDVRVELKRGEARVLLPFRSGAGARETWKGVVSVARDAEEALETLAARLAHELERTGVQRRTDGTARWYEAGT